MDIHLHGRLFANLSDNDCVALNDNVNISGADKNKNLAAVDLEGIDKNYQNDVLVSGSPSKTNTIRNADSLDERVKQMATLYQKNQRWETRIVHGPRQFNRYVFRCGTMHESGELKPLLKQEGIHSASSIYSEPVSKDSKENSEYLVPIPHTETYPEDRKDNKSNRAVDLDRKSFPEPTRECNDREKDLQIIQDNYSGVRVTDGKARRIIMILTLFNLMLIVCVIILTTFVAIPRDASYNNCFDCDFSGETLRERYQEGGSCCFDSISSVYLSLKQNQLEERIKALNNSLSYLQSLTLNGRAENGNFSTGIFENILSLCASKERTVVHLLSAEGTPEKVVTMYGVFHKVRWAPKDRHGEKSIISGKASILDGLNVQVQSEGYYFLYTRLHFKTKPGDRDVTISYTINRQRGSTSTYIHEVKERCMSFGSSLEHNGVAEIVVHLNKRDEIFVSVSQSDVHSLTTDDGDHIMGMFEL